MDTLASEYGWAKRDILDDTYLDEVLYLQEAISERNLNKVKQELLIAQNPHTKDPNAIFKELDRMETPTLREDKFDSTGFEMLKARMASNPHIIIKT